MPAKSRSTARKMFRQQKCHKEPNFYTINYLSRGLGIMPYCLIAISFSYFASSRNLMKISFPYFLYMVTISKKILSYPLLPFNTLDEKRKKRMIYGYSRAIHFSNTILQNKIDL